MLNIKTSLYRENKNHPKMSFNILSNYDHKRHSLMNTLHYSKYFRLMREKGLVPSSVDKECPE
jgi:hypothetical protein